MTQDTTVQSKTIFTPILSLSEDQLHKKDLTTIIL